MRLLADRSSLESSIQMSRRQHLTRRLPVTVATDPSRRIEEATNNLS